MDTAKHMPHWPSDQAKGALLQNPAGSLPILPSLLAASPANQQDTCALQQGDTPTPTPPTPAKPQYAVCPCRPLSCRPYLSQEQHLFTRLGTNSTPSRAVRRGEGGSQALHHLPLPIGEANWHDRFAGRSVRSGPVSPRGLGHAGRPSRSAPLAGRDEVSRQLQGRHTCTP